MEASAILKLVTDVNEKIRFIVHVIISDNDPTMQAHLTDPCLKKITSLTPTARGS